ncbi:MAG: RNA 2',3'-cyclic phosphodiesterase [Gammaproteobacteria bacterium]|nr:RNA 2',3'-cyclic phosphodiesterase [Gammaproteobacteria bacterium]
MPSDELLTGAVAGNAAPLRLFIGITCPCTPVIAGLLDGLLDELHNEQQSAAGSHTAGLRVVAPHNLHITLKFIGAAAATALPDIVSAMQQALANHHAFTLQLRGAGSFQSALWLGVEPNAALNALVKGLNEALAPLGFAPETKPYRPHLTLARLTHPPAPDPTPVGAGLPATDPTRVGAYPEGIKDPPATPSLSQKRLNPGFALEHWIAQHQEGQWGNLPVTAVHLYRSDTLADGVRYTILSTVPLRPPAA